jgi:serine/threonine protein kinase
VTVVDFGIAKIEEARGGVGTRQGVALGTPNYMAPEYLRGDVIDHRVDVYALGVVAWEMLTGESLWGEGDQPPTKIHEQQRTGARPLDPRAIKSHIPPELGAAVASALAFNPAERWPNVRAFALAVAHAVTSEWGETGMETLRRVARELTIAPGDDSTAGRPMPPPLAPTLQVAVPMTPTRFPPGAVPIVGSLVAPPHMPPLTGTCSDPRHDPGAASSVAGRRRRADGAARDPDERGQRSPALADARSLRADCAPRQRGRGVAVDRGRRDRSRRCWWS